MYAHTTHKYLYNKCSHYDYSSCFQESVMNRVAGFMCRYVLNGHYGCSPGLAVVERTNGPGYPITCLVI